MNCTNFFFVYLRVNWFADIYFFNKLIYSALRMVLLLEISSHVTSLEYP